MKKFLAFCVLLFSFTFVLAGDVNDDVANLIQSGNARNLSGMLNANVDLTILTQEGMYSKAQAEQILKDFFSKNTPKSMSLLHRGKSPDGSMYCIGSMQTADGRSLRTYFYLKQISGKYLITELRFEKE